MAILYLAIAGPATQQLVQHTETQVRLIEAAFNKLTLKNEGSLVVNRIINTQHPFLGPFIIPSVRQALDLPSLQKASREVGVEVPRLIQLAKQERATILLWSWLLVGMSLIYVGATVAMHRGFRARNVIFALTSVSVMFFVVGMSAPALALFTMPTIPLMNAKLTFVLQFEVRSILSVIAGLFSSKHVVLAVVISGFSIVTPLLKTILILIATTSNSAATRKSIVGFVHSIGKWSMADVLVAGVLLAIFALSLNRLVHLA
jgi:hypothetical protein